MDQKETNQIKAWYNDKLVTYNIFPYVKERTVDLITPREIAKAEGIKRNAFRYSIIKSFTGFAYNIENFKVVEEHRNFYASVAKINISKFPLIKFRSDEEKEVRKEINENYASYVTGYDFKIDIDNKDLSKAQDVALKIKRVLDEYELPYWVIFSGNKGFNFTIPTEYIPEEFVHTDRPALFKQIAINLGLKLALPYTEKDNEIEFESLDTGIYTLGRVFKVPYSIETHKNLVALPLTDKQLENFDVSEYTVAYVKKKVKLFNRGLLTRKGTKENVAKFLADFRPKEKPKKSGFFQKVKKAWSDSK